MRRRPVPSASVTMSFQVRTAASDTLSMPSRMRLINAMSRLPLHLAVSRLSILPPRPRRGLQAVDCIASRASAVSASACFWDLPALRVALLSVLFTSRPAQGSSCPDALWTNAMAAAAARSVAGLWPCSSARSAR